MGIWYEIIQYGLMSYAVCHILFTIGRWLRYFYSGTIWNPKKEIGDQRSLVNPSLIIPENRLIISIVCGKSTKTGTHAFLFFEWRENNVRMFARADFAYRRRVHGQDQFSDLVKGIPRIKVREFKSDIVDDNIVDFNGAMNFLGAENTEFQTFPYKFADEDISAKIKRLVALTGNFTYSSIGDTSSTSVNGMTNNQNCATWCAFVLKTEFGIDIKLDSEHWMAIRTPRLVVSHARKIGTNF